MITVRKKEPWMVNGNRVRVGSYNGFIASVIECVCGASIGIADKGKKMVMRVYVQLDGCRSPWPYSPFEIEVAK